MSDLTRYPLCWPNNVPRRPPHLRGRPAFQERSVSSAINFVLAEINRLNGRRYDVTDKSVIVSTNLRLRQDGLPYSDQAQPQDTGVAVFFSLRFARNGKWHERHTVLSCDRWCKVAINLTAIGKDIEAQRSRERWGCTSVEQAFQGYLAIPERCGVRPWWEILGVPSTASPDVIVDAYRSLAKRFHPDAAGESAEAKEKWLQISNAHDEGMATTP